MKEEKWDIEIKPKDRMLAIDFKEMWRYRDLFVLFVRRDISTAYKQTVLGPLWWIINPVLSMVVMVVVFGGIVGIPTDGVPAKDFTLNDINGNPLSLSALRGKYVILDFWGSWCGWCIKGIPDMKAYYNKYKDRLEILGIDCNDSETAWKSAVAKYEIPWLHVYNPSTSTLTDDYNITGYPTKIIIDPNGNINKVVVGEDPAFYDYLDQLLGK